MVWFAALLALALSCAEGMSVHPMSVGKELQQRLAQNAKDALQATKEAAQATKEAAQATKEAPQATTKAPQATKEAPQATKEAPKATKKAPQAMKEAPQATKEAPRNFLVLRLAHTGSSWLTAMLGSQEDTYITREAMFPTRNQEYIDHVESLGQQGVLDYLERVLTVPSGNIYSPDELQFFCNSTEEEQESAEAGTSSLPAEAGLPAEAVTSLMSQAITLDSFTQPKTCECLRNLGPECPLKFLGMTLDPTSQGLKYDINATFTAISQKHPDMPVLVLRRSNIVKHTLATGGMTENFNGSDYNVWLHRDVSVDQVMRDLRLAVNADQVLLNSAEFFKRVKLINYEDLLHNPKLVMDRVFEFLGMTGRFEDWMAEMGDKHTPDDLRLLINNFDELEHELNDVSPCLANQLRAKANKKFLEPCGDFWH